MTKNILERRPRSIDLRRKIFDRFMLGVLGFFAVCAITPLVLVVGFLLFKSVPFLTLDFFINTQAPLGEEGGGMFHSLLGTVQLLVIAILLGVPAGILVGLYLSEYPEGFWPKWVRFCADLMTSIPSIVIGIFVYGVLVITMGGFSLLSGGVALAIIMIPLVTRTTEEVLKLVPQHVREAGLALGISRWKVTVMLILWGSRKSVITGILLAVARVAGETAPLLFTAFNNNMVSMSLTQPVSSLPVQIYTYAITPYEEWQTQAWIGAFLLVALVFCINVAVRMSMRSRLVQT